MRSRISRGTPVFELVLGLAGLLVVGPVTVWQSRQLRCAGTEPGCARDGYLLDCFAIGFFSAACLFLAWLVWPFARNKRPLPCELAGRMRAGALAGAAVVLGLAYLASFMHHWWANLYAVLAVGVAVCNLVLHEVLEEASIHPDWRN